MSINQNFPATWPSLTLDFANSKTLDPRVIFTRASTGTYVGADGLIKYASADQARFDHNPVTGESLGLLIEQEGNNYFANSQTLSDWTISNASLTSTNETLSPDGNNNALKLTATGSGVIQHNVIRSTGINNYNLSTFSVWLKTASGNGNFQMSIGNVVYPGNASTGYLAVYDASVEEYPNGWFRFSVRRDWSTATGGVTLGIHLNANSGNGGYGVIATQSFEQSGEALYIWGAQWENNQVSHVTTTYIPTNGSTVTRVAERLNATPLLSAINTSQVGHTFVIDYDHILTNYYRALFYMGGTDGIEAWYGVSSSNLTFNHRKPLATVVGTTLSNVPSSRTILGMSISEDNVSVTRDGLTPVVNTTATITGVSNNFNYWTIGSTTYSTEHLNSTIRSLKYYPFKVTDSQLRSLTS